MKTILIFLLGGFVLLGSSALLYAQEYMGSQFCRPCHSSENPIGGTQYDGWWNTLHSRTIQLVADSTVYPLGQFNAGDSIDMGASYNHAKVYLSKVDTEFYIQVGTGGTKYKALMSTGWGYRQRYITKIDSSYYLLPIQFNPISYMNPASGIWIPYFPEYWFNTDGTPKNTNTNSFRTRAWDKNCVRCHSTAAKVYVSVSAGDTSWKTTWGYTNVSNYFGVGCEMCHGPFSGTAGQGMMFKLDNLPTKAAKIEVCGQCHSRGTSYRGMGQVGTHDYYKNELLNTYFNPIDTTHPLAEFANFCTPRNSPTIRGFYTWPDLFTSRISPQQYLEYQVSDHYTTTAMEIVCWTCHDSHPQTHRQYNIVDSLVVDGEVFTVRVDDNTLCLACHAGRGPYTAMKKEWVHDPVTYKDSIGALVTQHNHHPYDPTNTGNTGGAGQCVKCHMAMTSIFQNPYDQNSHTIRVVPPSRTLQFSNVTTPTKGMLSSCAVSCHRNPSGQTANVQSFGVGIDPTITDWTELTDIALAESLYAHWKEWGLGHPEFSIQPNGLNFGNTVLGYSRVDSMTFYNFGSTTINVVNVSSNRSEFVVTPTTTAILPGESQKLYITFTPAAEGHLTGFLSFEHDLPGSPEVVALAGSGILFESISDVVRDWNIVSVPYAVLDYRKAVLFPTAISPAFRYQSLGRYLKTDTLQNGVGYWAKFDTQQVITIGGIPQAYRMDELVKGWNIIGSLAVPLLISQLTTSPPDILLTDFFGYENGYYLADTLKPMKGYWVKVSEPGTLYLNAWGYPLKAVPGVVEATHSGATDYSKLSRLIIKDAVGKVQVLYFGGELDFLSVKNRELPPRPPAGVFDVRFHDDHFIQTVEAGASMRSAVEISAAAYPLRVEWKIQSSSVHSSLFVGDQVYALSVDGAATVSNSHSQIVLELNGSPGLPEQFALEQNYPNPFNPATVIRYSLPVNSFVTLQVYNVLGQEVATLVNEKREAGRYEVRWNASGLPSGVYYYRLRTPTFSKVHKMMLLR
ncbi:MAG: T9SS type A sorting domain-containing protein [Ignavibacteriae bacterium]|nr:T9SS type A sorting domain-containing protein [Ignavibacteriota bacterium]